MDLKDQNIVWIAQWYPHEGEPYAGDFIQRHAQAVSAFVPVTVYSCFGYDGEEKTEVNKTGNLTEVITYFKTFNTGIQMLDKGIYWNRWYRILKNLLVKHEKERGRPTLLHGHIILNTGWLGLWAKKNWNIPFIVTEHWAGYMKGFTGGFEAYNGWSKIKCKQIILQAAAVTGVSQALIKELKVIEPTGKFIRWPNVVNENTFFYRPLAKENSRPTFIHISTLTWQKNPEGIIDAIYLVKQTHPNVLLKIAGPVHYEYENQIFNLELEENISWLGEMPQEKLVDEIRSSDALVLFSQFESFGCVVIEANAAGVPVIVSDIEPLQELIEDGVNGFVAAEGNVESLAAAMVAVINKKAAFDNAAFSQQTLAQYSYPVVGKQMADLYDALLEKKS
jgi:glycosyltransferase involved in cell wall biosynthesis